MKIQHTVNVNVGSLEAPHALQILNAPPNSQTKEFLLIREQHVCLQPVQPVQHNVQTGLHNKAVIKNLCCNMQQHGMGGQWWGGPDVKLQQARSPTLQTEPHPIHVPHPIRVIPSTTSNVSRGL